MHFLSVGISFNKNGTEPGTRDCRWFTSIYFLVRYLFFFISALITGSTFFPLAAIALTLLKHKNGCGNVLFISKFCHYSNITATYIIFLALIYDWCGVCYHQKARYGVVLLCHINNACVPSSPLHIYHHVSVDNCTQEIWTGTLPEVASQKAKL